MPFFGMIARGKHCFPQKTPGVYNLMNKFIKAESSVFFYAIKIDRYF